MEKLEVTLKLIICVLWSYKLIIIFSDFLQNLHWWPMLTKCLRIATGLFISMGIIKAVFHINQFNYHSSHVWCEISEQSCNNFLSLSDIILKLRHIIANNCNKQSENYRSKQQVFVQHLYKAKTKIFWYTKQCRKENQNKWIE